MNESGYEFLHMHGSDIVGSSVPEETAACSGGCAAGAGAVSWHSVCVYGIYPRHNAKTYKTSSVLVLESGCAVTERTFAVGDCIELYSADSYGDGLSGMI